MIKPHRFLASALALALMTAVVGTALADDVPHNVYCDDLKQDECNNQDERHNIEEQKLQKAGVTDVSPDSFAAGAIAELVQAGVLTKQPGGTVQPTAPTNANVAVANFARVLGIAGKGDSTDAALQKAAAAGLTVGSANPDGSVSRLQVAQLLAKALGISPKANVNAANVPFKDAQNLSQNDMAVLAALYDAGVFRGFPDGSFQPDGTLTNEQMAVLMYRVMSKFTK